MGTTIEFFVVEKTFDASVIVNTDTQINIITETEKIAIVSTDLMVSNRRRPNVCTSVDRGDCRSSTKRNDIGMSREKMKIDGRMFFVRGIKFS